METLIDTADGIYSGGVLSGPVVFGASATLQTSELVNLTPDITGPYSETAVFQVTTTGPAQQANLTINIVPAPAIGHGLSAVLAVGGLLFGGMLYYRNKKGRHLGNEVTPAVVA